MLKSGLKVYSSSLKEYEKVYNDFVAHRVGTLRIQPGNWFLTLPFLNDADKIYNFKFKPTDVVIVTYPKCGTTWMQEIIWTIMKNPNLDNPNASQDFNIKCPFLEFDHLMNQHGLPILEAGGRFLQLAEVSEEPRIFKTHLPLSLLSPTLLDTCKVVYLTRNPKDVIISYHHHCRLLMFYQFVGNSDSFVDHMINDRLLYSPYWTHVKEGWQKRNHPNMLFCYYEDLKADPRNEIYRISKFLNVYLSNFQLDNVTKHTSFNSMRQRAQMKRTKDEGGNPYTNMEVLRTDGGFFRKGEVNDWMNKLSEEQIQKLDDWTRVNSKDFEEDFKYKI